MNNRPLVSVIVPVYNVEKYLSRCLDSLINQTLKNLEIICINDGSKDNSIKILEEYSQKDNRIIILNQDNAGLSAARNNGMNHAKGEYIGFVDSDDWVDLNFFEQLYINVKKYNADIGVAGIKRVRSYKWKYHIKFEKEEVIQDINKKFQKCDVPDKCYPVNKIYKLSELKKRNIYFEPNVYFEDRLFTAQVLINLKTLVTVPNTYYNYWTNPNSIVKTKSKKKLKDSQYTKEKLMKYLKENNVNLDHYYTKIKKFKILGLTFLKIKYYKYKKELIFLNQIKFQIKN